MQIKTEVTKCANCPHLVFEEDDMGPWDNYKCGVKGGPSCIRDRGIIDPACPINQQA